MHRSALLAMALVVFALSPTAFGSWSVGGNLEPDTTYDLSQARMWEDPDTEPLGSKVYFNAIVTDVSGVNPNAGLLGSRLITPTIKASAWLGIWKDCNRDEYIGHAESALMEYDRVLLTDTSVCPVDSLWNRNGWVSEFIHIGPRKQSVQNNFPRMLTDMDAVVWGDYDRPDVVPQPDVSCINAPVRRGTLDSTGALLLMVDCNTNYNVARAVNEIDRTAGLGLAFDGEGGHYRPDKDCDHPLNVQLDMYGDSPCNSDDPGLFEGGTGQRMFSVWDCASSTDQKFVDVRDPTAPTGGRGQLSSIPDPVSGEPLLYVTDEDGTYGSRFIILAGGLYLQSDAFNPLAPNLENTDGSLADSLTHTSDGLGPCAGAEGRDGLGEPLTNGNIELDPLSGKRNQDFTFTFAVRNGTPASTPENQGVRGPTGAPWKASEQYGPPLGFPHGIVRRADLKPASQTYFTFYARLGSSTLGSGSLAPSTIAAVYGGVPCGSFTTGVHNGWDCNTANWYVPALGGDEPRTTSQRVHARYHLIDTDCYDGSLGGGTGVFAGVAPLSDDLPCPSVP